MVRLSINLNFKQNHIYNISNLRPSFFVIKSHSGLQTISYTMPKRRRTSYESIAFYICNRLFHYNIYANINDSVVNLHRNVMSVCISVTLCLCCECEAIEETCHTEKWKLSCSMSDVQIGSHKSSAFYRNWIIIGRKWQQEICVTGRWRYRCKCPLRMNQGLYVCAVSGKALKKPVTQENKNRCAAWQNIQMNSQTCSNVLHQKSSGRNNFKLCHVSAWPCKLQYKCVS